MSPMSTDGINLCIDGSIDIDFSEDDFFSFSDDLKRIYQIKTKPFY